MPNHKAGKRNAAASRITTDTSQAPEVENLRETILREAAGRDAKDKGFRDYVRAVLNGRTAKVTGW